MRLTYDPGRDVLSIGLGDRAVASSLAASPGVALNLDADGNVVAIEVARASKLVNLASVDMIGLPVTEAAERGTHIVRPGDTLSAIAIAAGTTVDALVSANDLADPDLISVGQILKVPTR